MSLFLFAWKDMNRIGAAEKDKDGRLENAMTLGQLSINMTAKLTNKNKEGREAECDLSFGHNLHLFNLF